MSEWTRGTKLARTEFKAMRKEIDSYSYQDPKHAEATDERFRKAVGAEISKSRDALFPMVEAAYIDKASENAAALEDVMQWLDLFLLELGLPIVWNDHADSRAFSRVVKADVTLLTNTKKLAQMLESMNDRLMHSKSGSVVRRCAQLKKYIGDLLAVYKKRRHYLGG